MRIQKSLILDFDEDSARESAEQDWRIDVQRELTEKKQIKAAKKGGTNEDGVETLDKIDEEDEEDGNPDAKGLTHVKSEKFSDDNFSSDEEKFEKEKADEEAQQVKEIDTTKVDFERLSEFFFDLCLSWCQHLDIETFLFFINGVFLNITRGHHISVSTFKPMRDIEVLSIEFFNHLLAYRQECEERSSQTYGGWYSQNFGRTHSIVQ